MQLYLKIGRVLIIKIQFDHLDFHPTDFLEIREGLSDQDSYIATISGNKTGDRLIINSLSKQTQPDFRSSIFLDKQKRLEKLN